MCLALRSQSRHRLYWTTYQDQNPSLSYIADSDLEDESEDGPMDYPADEGDDDYDDLSRDDADDKYKEEASEEDEEEKHLASVDSTVVPPTVDYV
ncbi:hypothetical protein Tco_0423314, partial [Tanacetum coccineum]